MLDLTADSTIDIIALLAAAAGTFVYFLKYSARKRTGAAESKTSPASDNAEHGARS